MLRTTSGALLEETKSRLDTGMTRRPRPWLETRSTTRTIFISTPSSHLSGRVVDAQGRWVDDAELVVPRHALRARTADGGRFRLPELPTQAPTTLVVHARGRQQQFQLVQAGGRAAGVVIQLGY